MSAQSKVRSGLFSHDLVRSSASYVRRPMIGPNLKVNGPSFLRPEAEIHQNNAPIGAIQLNQTCRTEQLWHRFLKAGR